jgi:uncharacterized protein YutE (UPF0331/DUF86 family)
MCTTNLKEVKVINMYFVDRAKIENILRFLEENIIVYEGQKMWTTIIERHALERISQTMIESVLDVGNSMIDGFIMRDPGSFDDIVDILEDEKVVTPENAKSLKQIIRLRKMLVQDYTVIDHKELVTTIENNLHSLRVFPTAIRSYLENELGPVSAFKQ